MNGNCGYFIIKKGIKDWGSFSLVIDKRRGSSFQLLDEKEEISLENASD